jgi:hypothetical protein
MLNFAFSSVREKMLSFFCLQKTQENSAKVLQATLLEGKVGESMEHGGEKKSL